MANDIIDYSAEALFRKYSEGCSYFVETGSNDGAPIQRALDIEWIEKVFSCDINQEKCNFCRRRFEDSPVEIHNNLSTGFLRRVVPILDKKSLFWLDAHGEGGGDPLLEELELIAEHGTRVHNIMIDDIPEHYPGQEEIIKEKLWEINPNYTIEFMPIAHHQRDYIFVAHCQE